MSGTNSALISDNSERDRAKYVEQFDDVLRTFISETNKFENRFGIIRDEEMMLAVKKLMLESLLNFRFRGRTMSCSELLVSLENIIIDKVATVPTVRNRKMDTSAPMEIGMAARDDGENLREEGEQRIVSSTKEQTKGSSVLERVRDGMRLSREQRLQRWQRCKSGKKGSKGQEKGGKGGNKTCWSYDKTDHIAAWCRKGGNNKLYAIGEDDSENVDEATDNEGDLRAWCLSEEK